MRNEAKTQPGSYSRLDQEGETSRKDNTQTKIRNDSANVTGLLKLFARSTIHQTHLLIYAGVQFHKYDNVFQFSIDQINLEP